MRQPYATALASAQRLSRLEFFNKVFTLMGAALLVTFTVAYMIALDESSMRTLFHLKEVLTEDGDMKTTWGASGWWFAAAGLQLVMVFVICGSSLRKGSGGLFWGTGFLAFYAALNGVTLAPVLYAYTVASVTKVFFLTAVAFFGCALWGMVTKRDLTGYGTFFLYALGGLLALLVMNLFIASTMMDNVVSMVAILLFGALTAYDMQKLRAMHAENPSNEGLAVYGALALYLDFINLFLHLLRFAGIKVTGD